MQNKAKLLLIYPPAERVSFNNTPTGLLYIATFLKKNGYNARLIDCSVEKHYKDILENEVKDADLLGIYAMSVHLRLLLPLVSGLKKINKGIKIIWGGPHASLFPEETAKSSLADIVVRGEGEEVMLEILKGYQSGSLNLHKIKGISFRGGNNIVTTPDRGFINLNDLPMLDWSFVKQEVLDVIKKTIIRVQTTRGCPYNCAFCINLVTKNRTMRYRDPEKVLDEIEYLYREYRISRVGFRDEVFMLNREHVRHIAQGLIDRKIRITWLANPRVEYLRESYVDDAYLKLLADSGCTKFATGAESGSQRILDLLKKGSNVEDTLNFVKRAKKFNIVPALSFMTGIPTETEDEQMQTIKLIKRILEINPNSFIVGPQNFRPYPGGELFDTCVKKYNLKIPGSLEEWAKFDILGASRQPWTKRAYFNQYLWISISAAINTTPKYILAKLIKNPLKGLAAFFMMIISKFRLKFLFYRFPFEFLLLHWYHRFIVKKVPELS